MTARDRAAADDPAYQRGYERGYERGHIEGYEKGLTDPGSAWMTSTAARTSAAERADVCPTCTSLPGNPHDPQNDMGCAWTDSLIAAVERILAARGGDDQ